MASRAEPYASGGYFGHDRLSLLAMLAILHHARRALQDICRISKTHGWTLIHKLKKTFFAAFHFTLDE